MSKSIQGKNETGKISKHHASTEAALPRFINKKSVEIYMKDAYGVSFQNSVHSELKYLIITLFKAFQGEVSHRNRSFEMLEVSFLVTD